MTWVWSTSFIPYTISSVTSQLTGYEATKLGIYDEHSYIRSWRSNNSLLLHAIRFTFASPQDLAGIAIFNLNGPLMHLWRSTDGGSNYFDIETGGTTIPRTATKYLGYYRYFLPLTGVTGVTDVQVRVQAQTPVDGAAYFEIGSVVLLSSLTSFPHPPLLGMRERLVRPYDQSGQRKRQAGPWRSEMEWQMLLRDTSQISAWQQIALQGEDAMFLVAKANAETSQVYLMSYDGAMEFEDQKRYGRVNPRWVEMA